MAGCCYCFSVVCSVCGQHIEFHLDIAEDEIDSVGVDPTSDTSSLHLTQYGHYGDGDLPVALAAAAVPSIALAIINQVKDLDTDRILESSNRDEVPPSPIPPDGKCSTLALLSNTYRVG